MRLKIVLVGLAAVTGIAAATVAGEGVSTADPAPAPTTAATVGVLATNLGLNTEEARSVQYFLISRGYNPGTPDGQLGVSSWKAMQRYLRDYGYGYTGTIDGVVGANTIKALQRRLADGFGYSGDIDGKAGPATTAAFKRFANEWT